MELRNRNIGQVPPRGNVRLGERLHGVEEPLPGEDRIAGAIDRNQDVYVQPDFGGVAACPAYGTIVPISRP